MEGAVDEAGAVGAVAPVLLVCEDGEAVPLLEASLTASFTFCATTAACINGVGLPDLININV